MIIITTSMLGTFLQEVGTPVVPGKPGTPPSPERILHFMERADRYSYWNATPEEDARVRITVLPIEPLAI